MTDSEKIKTLNAKHPYYELMVEDWELYRDAYKGKGGFADGKYLWRGTRERDNHYTTRKTSASYLNLYRPAIDKFLGWLFQGEISYENAPEEFTKWLETYKIEKQLEKAARNALIYGSAPVIMDALSSGSDPYLIVYNPLNLYDWQVEYKLTGELTNTYTSAKIAVDVVDTDIITGKHHKAKIVNIWTPETQESWKIIDNKAEINVDSDGNALSGNNSLGYAPLINLDFTIGDDPEINVPIFDSLASMCKRIFNWQSEQRTYAMNHLINPMLKYPGARSDKFPISTEDNVIYWNPAIGGEPGMMFGDSAPLREYREQVNSDIEHSAFASGLRGPAAYAYPQSGEAYKQQGIDTVAILNSLVADLEGALVRIGRMWADFTNKQNMEDIKPVWPDLVVEANTFSLDDVLSIEDSEAFQQLKTVRNATFVELAKIISRNDSMKLSDIIAEIASLPADAGNIPEIPEGATPSEAGANPEE